jgi:NitT/TauT family transport system substrate-binding protein
MTGGRGLKNNKVLFSAALFLGLMLCTLVRAETVVLAVPGPGSLSYLPLYLAKAIGADHAEGLELKLRYFSGGPMAARDLMTNNSDFLASGLPAIAASRAEGQPILAIGQLSCAAMYALMLRTDLNSRISTLKQLKGRRIGTGTGLENQRPMGQMVAEFLLHREDLASNEVRFVSAGQDRTAQTAAMTSGTVDALMADEPFASELVAKGIAVKRVDLYSPAGSSALFDGPIVHATLATREDVYANHPETVKKVQRMLNRSLEWIAQHSARELVTMLAGQPGFKRADAKALAVILQRNQGMYPKQISWDAKAVSTTETFFHQTATNPSEQQLRFSSFVRDVSGN